MPGLSDDVRARLRGDRRERARHVRIDLDAAAAIEPGPRADARPGAPLPGGLARGRDRLPAHARRDQLRLRLVPDAAQAAGLLGLLHGRLGAGRPLPRARAVDPGRAERLDAATVATVLGQDSGTRADGPLRARRCATSAASSRTHEPSRRGGRLGRAPGRAARRGHADVRRRGLLEARADHRQRPHPGRRRRVRRHRQAHDLRRQPRPARAAHGRRPASTTRSWPPASTPASCCRPATRSARSGPARCTPASRSPPSSGIPPRTLDVMLWNRGQEPRYKARPRHRTRTIYY